MISRDDCRKRAFEYFLAAEETGDDEKRKALREGGEKWFRVALQTTQRHYVSFGEIDLQPDAVEVEVSISAATPAQFSAPSS